MLIGVPVSAVLPKPNFGIERGRNEENMMASQRYSRKAQPKHEMLRSSFQLRTPMRLASTNTDPAGQDSGGDMSCRIAMKLFDRL